MKRVLITGAGSYVGGKVRKRLEREPERFEVEELDVKDSSWRDFDMSGFDSVYHVAGIAHVSADPSMEDLYMSVNRDLAIEVGRRAKEAGVRQFIFMSSAIVYGDALPPEQARPITKETPINPSNYYGLSKVEAEIGLMELASSDFRVAILRCPMIYGPDCRGNFPKLVRIARMLPVFPNIENRRSMLYVGNLAELIATLVECGEGGLFLPQNAEWSCTSELVEAIAERLGRKCRLTSAFNPALFLVLGKSDVCRKAFGSLYYAHDLDAGAAYQRFSLKESVRASILEGSHRAEEAAGHRACIVNCFDTYASRVALVRKCLEERGFDVTLISSDYMHIAKRYRESDDVHENLVHVRAYDRNISLGRIRSHEDFCNGVRGVLAGDDYDLVWALIPPNDVGRTCAEYKKAHPGAKLVVDVIDMWPETMPYAFAQMAAGIAGWERTRTHALESADLVVTECDLFAERIKELSPAIRTQTIYFARESRYISRTPEVPEDRISLCYLGSINHLVDIDAIGRIVAKLSNLRPVEVHIIGQGESQDALEARLRQEGARVVSHGVVYEWDDKQRIFDKCHYGLNVMKESVFVGLTMKSVDYLDAGLPLINSVPGDTWDLVAEHKVGHNFPQDDITLADLQQNYVMRRHARAIFVNIFSEDVFASSVDAAMESITKIRRKQH